MNIMLLSVSVWSGAADMPQETRDFFHWLSALIALPAGGLCGPAVLPERVARAPHAPAQHGRADFARRDLLALGMSLVETASHAQHAYFNSATMLLFFLLCGRALDHAMRRKTRAVAGNLAALKAEFAHRFDGAELVRVPAAALQARRPAAGAPGRSRAGRR